jgi:hypothetical protein
MYIRQLTIEAGIVAISSAVAFYRCIKDKHLSANLSNPGFHLGWRQLSLI